MGTRNYIYSNIAVLLAALLVQAVLFALALLRQGGPTHGLYDMRDPSRLPPYQATPTAPTRRLTVYGPYFTEHFDGPAPMAAIPAPPEAIVEADTSRTATLPNGRRVGLRALRFFPQPGAGGAENLPVEQVYCDPEGRWMDHDAALELHQQLLQLSPEPGMAWNRVLNPSFPWFMGIVLATDAEATDLVPIGLFDTRTGGRVADTFSVEVADLPDGAGRLVTFGAGIDGVRPTPMALHLHVRTGEATVISLAPTAPQTFVWEGRRYTLLNIAHWDGSHEVLFAGTPLPPGHRQQLTISSLDWRLTFQSLPEGLATLSAYDKQGNEITSVGNKRLEFGFEGHPEDIGRLEIVMKPDHALVVIPLPELPVVPEANRHTSDLMAMVLPPVDEDYPQGGILAGALLQLRFTFRAGSVLIGQHSGGTVGDYVGKQWLRNPLSEIVMGEGPDGPYLDRLPAGTTRARLAPRRAAAMAFVLSWRSVALALALLAVIKLIGLARAVALRRALRPRGYAALTILQAETLVVGLGRRAWKLPAREELAIIPGVDVEDMRTVVTLMRGKTK